MKSLLLSAAIGLACALPAMAQDASSELSAPIVAFTPVIAKNADALGLDDAQRAALKDWLSTMPAKRKELEGQAVEARAALRQAIIAGASDTERQELAEKVGALETELVLMRSACTDHWRAILTAEQFAKMVELAQTS